MGGTARLGGHVDECNNCGHIKISYNSCRNRHCPKCQGLAREKWLAARKKDLLPVSYFHIVFTIPHNISPVVLRNQKELYTILFKAASETLLELGKDKKHLGAEIGLIAILHTWGQNLMDHPHLHCLVPGGGLSFDGKEWIKSKEKFFIPVKVMSRLFRGKFLAYFKAAYKNKKLKFEGAIKPLSEKKEFQNLLDQLYQLEWVVYCKEPFSCPEYVLEYLGHYTHRVAISNNRLVKMENKKVTFRWRDYSDGSQNKLMTLNASEFIRRFLLHILPDNFVKIRHYGLLSNRSRKTKLNRCQELLGRRQKEDTQKATYDLENIEDMRKCPCCKNGTMIKKEVLHIGPLIRRESIEAA